MLQVTDPEARWIEADGLGYSRPVHQAIRSANRMVLLVPSLICETLMLPLTGWPPTSEAAPTWALRAYVAAPNGWPLNETRSGAVPLYGAVALTAWLVNSPS